MKNYLYLFLLYFINIFFIKSAESHINIVDNDVAQYFDSNWVNNIKNKRNTIIIKMNKVKMLDGAELEDYESTYECQKDIKYNGNEYRILINIEKDHKLTYDIKKKQGPNWIEITDDNDEKIFYDFLKKDTKTNKNIYDKSPESTLQSYNWVLAKIKPKDEDNYFYVFINNIDHIVYGRTRYCCLGLNNKIEKFYFIYSKINCVDGLSRTLNGYNTHLENIDLKGLNFNVDSDYNLSNWFENAADLKKFKNFPKFNNKIDIKEMVKGCKNLEDVDLGENKIDNASSCFTKCENLKNVNLQYVSITENANLSNMFNHCKISENLKGIETLIKDTDKPNVNCMFFDCNIEGNLDLSQWGTNMKTYKYLFSKSNLKNLTLFNLKELIKKNKEKIENNKKKIDEFYKKYPDKNLNSKIKSLILLNKQRLKEELNAEDSKRLNDLENDDEIKKVPDLENYKKEFEDIIKMEILNDVLKSPDILKDSTIGDLNINEEFMPDNKQDLNKILGSGYNITGDINIIKSNGEIVKYKSFNDYPYKEKEQEKPSEHINPQIPEKIKNIDEKEIPKGNTCLICCGKCFSKCCCCCKRNV